MAVKKKSSPKKTTTATKKKVPVRKTKKSQEVKSFKRSSDTQEFMNFQITIQTVYWLIIAVLVVGLASWILLLQKDITDLYRQIDQIRANEDTMLEVQSPKKD